MYRKLKYIQTARQRERARDKLNILPEAQLGEGVLLDILVPNPKCISYLISRENCEMNSLKNLHSYFLTRPWTLSDPVRRSAYTWRFDKVSKVRIVLFRHISELPGPWRPGESICVVENMKSVIASQKIPLKMFPGQKTCFNGNYGPHWPVFPLKGCMYSMYVKKNKLLCIYTL